MDISGASGKGREGAVPPFGGSGMIERMVSGKSVTILVLLLSAGGCSIMGLREDLQVLEQTSLFTGTVTVSPPTDKPICISLYRDAPGQKKQLDAYQVIYQRGDFAFRRPPGDYYLFAFEDANEDVAFQHEERVGWYGNPTILTAQPGVNYEGLQIALRQPEEAQRELPQLYADTAPSTPLKVDNRHLGQIEPLDSPRFAQEAAELGMWEPMKFMERFGAGLFFLAPYDPAKIPVVFVHGMGGTPRNFRFLIDNLDRSRFQPLVLHYPSAMRLPLMADGLAKYLNELQVRYRFKNLIIVAHSMGGLVARGAINRLNGEGKSFVSLFVSISAPWNGHPGAATGIEHSPAIIPCWYDMAPGSPFLRSLQTTPLPAGTRYFLLFSHRGGSAMLAADENSDGTLPLASMLEPGMQECAEKVIGFNESHTSILNSEEVSKRLNEILANSPRSLTGPSATALADETVKR